MRLRHEYGIKVPLNGIRQRLAVAYVSLKYKIQDALRNPEKARHRLR